MCKDNDGPVFRLTTRATRALTPRLFRFALKHPTASRRVHGFLTAVRIVRHV